ncbi:MAG: NAD-dependent epimerase/dehydratase family protein [Mucilaginibacter sp.]|nr:NAD-dependent epimerase/dehydratase family protein [Mucilaginibacter sp.]
MEKILVIGALGQIGTELTAALRLKYSFEQVIAADLPFPSNGETGYIQLNVLDKPELHALVIREKITQIYHLAAMLSARAEAHPQKAWELNMQGLLNVLDIAKADRLLVFWPSSIAVFGKNGPLINCPQHTVTQPSTLYGISKAAGENLCQYYWEQYGVDVRSLRYPGLISYSSPAGGGTTDYAVDVFHHAARNGRYTCFLKASTRLPMMYMEDAVRATLELMAAPADELTVRTAYNIAAMSFTPIELAHAIAAKLPGFRMSYEPDNRQQIANGWPQSIDDKFARRDWGWRHRYEMPEMVSSMLAGLGQKAV